MLGGNLTGANESGLIGLERANKIWEGMLAEGCWAGADSFYDSMDKPYTPLG